MRGFWIFTLVSLWSFSAMAVDTDLGRFEVDQAYFPQGFDSNDIPEFVVAGTFPNQCYRVKEVEVDWEEISRDRIYFSVIAHKYGDENCDDKPTDFMEVVDLGRSLNVGTYEIYESLGEEEKRWGKLPVTPARSLKRDEFPYPNVTSASILYPDELIKTPRLPDPKLQARYLYVVFYVPSRCWELDESKVAIVKTNDHLVEVLPIIKHSGNFPCPEENVRRRAFLPIPEEINADTYLFHIRKADGKSYNMIEKLRAPK